jgi:hypothetical protein
MRRTRWESDTSAAMVTAEGVSMPGKLKLGYYPCRFIEHQMVASVYAW